MHTSLKILKILFEPKQDIRSDDCARNNYMKVSIQQKFVIYQFLRVEQETHNSSKKTTHVFIFVHAK